MNLTQVASDSLEPFSAAGSDGQEEVGADSFTAADTDGTEV